MKTNATHPLYKQKLHTIENQQDIIYLPIKFHAHNIKTATKHNKTIQSDSSNNHYLLTHVSQLYIAENSLYRSGNNRLNPTQGRRWNKCPQRPYKYFSLFNFYF